MSCEDPSLMKYIGPHPILHPRNLIHETKMKIDCDFLGYLLFCLVWGFLWVFFCFLPCLGEDI